MAGAHRPGLRRVCRQEEPGKTPGAAGAQQEKKASAPWMLQAAIYFQKINTDILKNNDQK